MAAIFLTLGLLFCSCKKNPVVPPTDEPHNPRNYTWVRDTLGDGSFQSSLTSIWGSSPNDVYVCGHSSFLSAAKIFHWNGINWTDYTGVYHTTLSNYDPIPWDPVQVVGFSQSDVWIVGYRDTSSTPQEIKTGFILHYTGSSWEDFLLPGSRDHFAIGGVSSSDLWVGGIGQMFHYDGQLWEEVALNDSIAVLNIKAVSSNEVYAAGWMLNNSPFLIHYRKWNGTSWDLIESRYDNEPEPGFRPSFDIIGGQLYSPSYHAINKQVSNGVWQQVFYDATTDLGILAAFGASNAFALGRMIDQSEAVIHFDGNDWQRIAGLNRPDASIIRAWSTDSETFLVSQDAQSSGTLFPRSYVLRGK